MTKLVFNTLSLFILLILSACYTDDSSQPSPDRLPFEDFNDFFQQNNAVADTLAFNPEELSTLTTLNGTTINIPDDAFSLEDTIWMEIKNASAKSDFVFLNKPTVDGNNWIEASRSVFIKPFVNAGAVDIENPISLNMELLSGTNGDDMDVYYFENGWNKDNSFDVSEMNSTISFETKRSNWQIGGKVFDNNGGAQLTINPVGYGIVPHDMRAFVVLSDYNVVLPMDHNTVNVSASANVPTGEDFHVVVMVMDHFSLSVAVEAFNINENLETEISVDKQSPEEMIMTIKGVD